MIAGTNSPTIIDLEITNYDVKDTFMIYNLLGFIMTPEEIVIGTGETKNVQLRIYPREDLETRGYYSFNYFIRATDDSESTEKITFKIIDLKDAFEMGTDEINLDSNQLYIYIHNKENYNFNNIKAKFSSAFFDFEKEFSLEPNQRKDFIVELNQEDFNKLTAGYYTITSVLDTDEGKTTIETTTKFAEKDLLTTTIKDSGFIINTKIIEKINRGNVIAESQEVIKKNVVSRLFTSFSPEPDIIERDGLIVSYTWDKEIKPGETLQLIVKTNWLFPILVIFFIVSIVILVKQYTKTNLVLKKRVSFVRAKGQEFALKISILVHAKKYLERVNIVDRLPGLVKLYEKFGIEKPTRINLENKKLEWQFQKLEQGETRMLSYIIYSKVGILGKFALPKATAVYEKAGKILESISNKTFFIAEQRKDNLEE